MPELISKTYWSKEHSDVLRECLSNHIPMDVINIIEDYAKSYEIFVSAKDYNILRRHIGLSGFMYSV